MFHILSLENPVYNVPLESLQKREELKRIERAAAKRKILPDPNAPRDALAEKRRVVHVLPEEDQGEAGARELAYALNAYRAAIHVDDDGRQLLHAFEIMSSPVITLRLTMSIADGWRSFQEKEVRHMPVLSTDSRIIGIVSERDLLKELIVRGETIQSASNLQIADVMTRQVISASRETDIRRIARAMFENHIGTMPIVDDHRLLIGIITRGDILYALIHYGPLKLWA